MRDLISRQAAIDEVVAWLKDRMSDKKNGKPLTERLRDLPSAQSEKTEMIKEIRKWINSGNRGNADYFIVEKIEEIINKYE